MHVQHSAALRKSLKVEYVPILYSDWIDSRVASGPIPPELGGLVTLEGVDLSSNRLNGEKQSGLPRAHEKVHMMIFS